VIQCARESCTAHISCFAKKCEKISSPATAKMQTRDSVPKLQLSILHTLIILLTRTPIVVDGNKHQCIIIKKLINPYTQNTKINRHLELKLSNSHNAHLI